MAIPFTLPWRVADGVKLDMDVRSESEHIQGYSSIWQVLHKMIPIQCLYKAQ